jgi:hypothetical protein
VQKYGYKLQDGQIYKKTNIHTYFAYLQYCTYNIQTDRQTARTDGKKNYRQTVYERCLEKRRMNK